MDMTILLVFLALFLIASISLFAVYKLGIKEKSYEEALAEQRQQTSVLLGSKAKPKEKKNKKVAKKPKDKEQHKGKAVVIAAQEQEESENNANVAESSLPEKLHVEFKEEPEEVVQVPVKPKRVKKVRPILIKRDKSPIRADLLDVEAPVANHFEENPPKDDLELLRLNSREDLTQPEPPKEKTFKEKKNAPEVFPAPRNKKDKSGIKQLQSASVIPETVATEKSLENAVPPPPLQLPPNNSVVVIGNPGKEKKKKKSEFNTRQQLTSNQDGLLNSVRKAELSKTEIQMLIDLLLNKQLDGPGTVVDDWTEGKSDPVQKLKRQLADKEKALEAEQQALISAQAKLREIRAEQQTEKQQLQQKIRTLEELAQTRQIEMQAVANRLQVGAQKVQQLQAELNNEKIKTRKLMEENAAIQRQAQQMQETETIIAKLRKDCEDLSAQNQQLRLEIQQTMADKEQLQQHFLLQMGNLEKTLEQQNELNRQLKENNQKLERNLEIAARQRDEWSMENTNLKGALQQQYEEKLKLEHTLHQMNEELHVASNEKIESAKIIAQLKTDLKTLQEQFSHINGTSEDNKNHKVEMLNLNNELSSVKNELLSVQSQLQQADKKYKSELETFNKQYVIIEKELEEQKAKNNELRIKNWKVMEALKAAESNVKPKVDDNEKIKREIISKEQESQKQFIQRLFPEIDALNNVTSDDWQEEFGKLIKNYVLDLKTQQKSSAQTPTPPSSPQKEVAKLQSQVLHYKTVIDDTEGMLNMLQLHVENEEINWRNKQAVQQVEIERLKCETSQQQAKLTELERQLAREIEEKKLMEEKQSSVGSLQEPSHQDQTAVIEQLSEEVNRLRELLKKEQMKNEEIGLPVKAPNSCSNTVNGSNFVEVPAIRNVNICSNMGCQFLYCDGNSCQGGL